jgi:PAS domain S-box-containing protein
MESGSAEAETRQRLRSVTMRVDRDWVVGEIVDSEGQLKLETQLAPGARLLELVHPDDVEILKHNCAWCAANEGREVVLRVRYRRGPDWWTSLLTTIQCFPGGTTEVTLALDNAVAARATAQQLRHVVDESQQGIMVRTLTKALYVNEGMARMLGYENVRELAADEKARNREAVHPDDMPVMLEHLRRRLSGEEKFSQYELRLLRRDGSYLWVETMASFVVWEGQAASLSWMIDISARKSAEAELIKSREAAERANRVKSDFLASMSHELRTPLNAILGFSEMISTEMFGSLHPRYHEYANDIHRSGRHLLDLINDILDLSKLEAGKLFLREGAVDLVRVVGDAIALVRRQADEKQLVIEESFSHVVNVRADIRALKQVAINLLSNAIKFTPPGGRVSVNVAATSDGGVELAVIDTGIGMTSDEIDVAMEPFGQVDSLLTREQPGTGLGLPISLALMKLHGGGVRVESSPGEGTTLTAWLPGERVIAAAA